MSEIWNLVIFQPFINALLFLYSVLGRSFGLSIIVFTILVRLLTLPVTQQQARWSKATQELQPKIQELQKKYKNEPEKFTREQSRLYKEAGISQFGCLVPFLIQFPVWIGLYQSISNVLPTNPHQLLNLARHIYVRFPVLSSLVPMDPIFLGLNLGRPAPVLAILTAVTMWAQQKMMATPSADPQQKAMSQSMELTMPLMFLWILWNTASGLGLYFVVTNLLGMIQQYQVGGWGGLATVFQRPSIPAGTARPKGKGDGPKK
ncbi:MAG: YidC/Oxa1 family membrane protein insertase [Chloroflexi bacterium]|nr:YidC/Oxa1 family membrane protein insertase [Chloroflexota bacterium]